jgi:hypothetical protein
MEWLTSNIFFLVILLLCIGMHLFGHGGHGGHGDSDRRDRDAQRSTRTNPHRHH